MWFQDMAQDGANSNAQAGTLQNQITLEMLTNTRQYDSIEAQIQSPPWWKTILTVIIVIILFLLFAFYICNYLMNFISKRFEAFKLQMIIQAPMIATGSSNYYLGPLDQRSSI